MRGILYVLGGPGLARHPNRETCKRISGQRESWVPRKNLRHYSIYSRSGRSAEKVQHEMLVVEGEEGGIRDAELEK